VNLGDHYRERLAIWSDIQDHLEYLHDAVLAYEEPVVIELGVRSGNSTAALLSACEETGGRLWSADINPPTVPSEFFAGPWELAMGDSVSPAVLDWMPEQCDVLFVDTSHTVEQTLAELNAYMPRVKPGGIALFHDTQWEYPNISLPETGGPVTEGLHRWCAATGITWTNRQSAFGYYGLGIIQP
jgi:predicted O-methyltransferase YrrM